MEVEAILDNADSDGNGSIDFNEFMTAAHDRLSLMSQENLKKAFSTLDLNGDGFISIEELRSGFAGYMAVASDKEWLDMMQEVDQNEDGLIQFSEFKVKMMQVLELNYFGKGSQFTVSESGSYLEK